MRKLSICGVLAAGMWLVATPASAYEGPWCVKASMGFGVVSEICHYRSFAQCRDERPAWGSSAFCVQNPRYLPYWQGQGGPEPRRKFRKKQYRG